ncbi:VapC toxin family PIN domain ribonuclease [Streptomyces sp. NPDC087844]|uniref:VapC toxin family PIN domain ribonuclease n=1 Tax=Streptomyces sp. NPDC087844 TaxID=3365805 RepID=UPI00380E8016
MNAAQFLIDTSALARFMPGEAEQYGWDQAAAVGLIATCPITELKFFCSARSAADRARGIEDMRLIFGWVPVYDRAYDRACNRARQVQEALTKGRSARSRTGPPTLTPPGRPRPSAGRAGVPCPGPAAGRTSAGTRG